VSLCESVCLCVCLCVCLKLTRLAVMFSGSDPERRLSDKEKMRITCELAADGITPSS